MLKRLAASAFVFAAIMLTGVGCPGQAAAQVISQRAAVCDPAFPTRCIKPAADGSVAVTGGGGGGSTNATASAAALPVTAGTGKPLNIDLFSQERVLVGDTAGNPIDWSAPVPIMGANGTTILANANPAPISDAGGSITIDGSLTNITGTITLPTLAATSTLQSSVQRTVGGVVGNDSYLHNGSDGVIVNFPSAANGLNSTGTDIAPTQGVAQCDDASNTAITENSFGNLRMSCTNHALVVRPYETAANSWSYAAASGGISNTTTAVTIHASCGAGLKNYISGLQLSSDALGAATELVLRDGAGGTVLWRGKVQTAGVSGVSTPIVPPISGTAATLMEIATLTATVTGGVYANAQGFCAP